MTISHAYSLRRAAALAVCLPVFILAFAACSDGQNDNLDEQGNTIEEQAEQTQNPDQTQNLQAEMNEFAISVENTFRETDRELEEIGQRIGNAGDNSESEMEQELKDLRQRRDSIQADLDRLGDKEGEKARDMREALQGRIHEYERDLRTVRLKTVESKEEFVKVAQTEMQEIDEQINQMERNLSQVDSTQRSDYDERIAEFKEERKELETNMKDVMSSGSEEFSNAQAAMAEHIASFRSEVDQTFDDVKGMDHGPRAASTEGNQ